MIRGVDEARVPRGRSSAKNEGALRPAELLNETAGEPGLRVAVVGCGYWGSKHVRVLDGTEGVAR